MNDQKFLRWIHDRLQRYGDHPNTDFMLRLSNMAGPCQHQGMILDHRSMRAVCICGYAETMRSGNR